MRLVGFVLALPLWWVAVVLAQAETQTDPAPETPLFAERVERTERSGDVQLSVKVDRTHAMVAELIRWQWIVDAPRGTMVRFPEFDSTDWTVIEVATIENVPMIDSQQRRWQREIVLESLEVATRSLPAVEVSYRLPGEQQDQTIRSESIEIEIRSVLATEEQPIEPRSIKGAVELPEPTNERGSAVWVIAILLVAALCLSGWWLYPRRRQPDYVELARRQVDAVESAFHQHSLSLAECYEHLSATLRTLMEVKLGIPATSASIDELQSMLIDIERSRGDELIVTTREFLETADRVRFGGQLPSESDSPFQSARELIRMVASDAPTPREGQ